MKKCVDHVLVSITLLMLPYVSTVLCFLNVITSIPSKWSHHTNVLVHGQPHLPRRRHSGLVAPTHLCTHSDQRCGVLGHADGQVHPQPRQTGVIGLGRLCS